MDKQTTLAFVLIGIVLVVWLYMTAPEPVVEEPRQTEPTTILTDTIKTIPPVETTIEKPENLSGSQIEDSFTAEAEATEEIITVENDVFIVELSNQGGNIRKVFLKKFNNWYSINSDDEENY